MPHEARPISARVRGGARGCLHFLNAEAISLHGSFGHLIFLMICASRTKLRLTPYPSRDFLFLFSRATMRRAIAAGVMPDILDAWPRETGLT